MQLQEVVLQRQTSKINDEVIDTFDYVSNLLKFLGEQISSGDPQNLTQVSKLLQGRLITNQDVREQFPWAMFDWSTVDKKMVVSTAWGVMENSKDISYRNYAKMAFVEPWKLHFDNVDIGISSGKLVIPAGMGVVKNNIPVGILSLGFSVDQFIYKIEKSLNANKMVSFLVLDRDRNIVLHSRDIDINIIDIQALKDELHFVNNLEYTKLDKPVSQGNVIFSGYKNINSYPFTILVGYNNIILNKELRESLVPGIVGYLIIGITCLILLSILRFLIVSPIIDISKAADKISKGNLDTPIPHKGPYEIFVLSKQLINVKRYIKKIQRIDRELLAAKERAEEASIAKSQFLGNMSHELRTPLNAILGFAEMIKKEVVGPVNDKRYVEFASYVHDSGRHLLILIDDLLDISKAEAGFFTVSEAIFNPVNVYNESLKILNERASQSEITIISKIPANLPLLYGDETRFKQMILNVVSNAIKFSHRGGEVECEMKVNSKGFHFITKDQGIGIAKEDLHKVLNKFGQANQQLSRRKGEGSGLGLWLTRTMVEAHQGTIDLKSTLNKGATVTITFPEKRIITASQTETAAISA